MIKRVLIYVAGIFILGFGLVLNTKTGLGTSPIVSTPFVLSKMTALSLGTWTFIFYIIYIAAQIIFYRKIDLKVLLQIPFSLVMARIVDFYNMIIKFFAPNIPVGLIMTLIAIFCTALGAFLMVQMDIIVNPADGFVNGLTHVTKKPFGTCKMSFDFTCILLSLVIGLVGAGHIIGLGIGTIMCATLIGTTITYLDKYTGRYFASIVLKSRHIGEKYDH